MKLLFISVVLFFAGSAFGANFTDLKINFSSGNTGKWIKTGNLLFSNGQRRNTSSSGPLYNQVAYFTGYAMARKTGASSTVTLTSPVLPALKNDSCLEFYYYIFGLNVGQLKLEMLQPANVNQGIWNRTGSYFDSWHRALVNIRSQRSLFQLRFTLAPNSGSIALGLINPIPGRCGQIKSASCDFESYDFCSWNASTAGYRFNLVQAKNTRAVNNTVDHSTMTKEGYVAVPMAAEGANIGDIAELVSPKVANANGNYCLTFWNYQLDPSLAGDQSIDTIEVYIRNNLVQTQPLWSSASQRISGWNRVRVTIPFGLFQNAEAVIKATKVTNDPRIAIDDVSLESGNCPKKATCDFNFDLCGFTHDKNTPTNKWMLGYGRVTDPSKLNFNETFTDHSNALSGKFIYTDFTGANFQSPTGTTIRSEMMDPVSNGCLSFWYWARNMVNRDTSLANQFSIQSMDMMDGIQNIWMYNTSNDNNNKLPFGFQSWQFVQVPLKIDFPHRIRFAAFTYIQSTFVAVDDVEYSTNPCVPVPTDGGPVITIRPPITTKKLPTAAPNQSVACDFENNNFCKLQVRDNSWKINSAADYTPKMPVADHTKQNVKGRYAYTRQINQDSGPSNSSLMWAVANGIPNYKGPACLRFWYQIRTDDARSHLDVQISQRRDGNEYKVNSWTRQGDQGEQWQLAMVDYFNDQPITMNTFKFTGFINSGVIAIDDIKTVYTSCQSLLVNEFYCSFENPVMGSNGQNTSMCGFANQISYKQLNILKGTTQNSITITDHTLKTSAGHYLGVEVKNSNAAGLYQVISDWQPPTTSACLIFSYLMSRAQSKNQLKMSIQLENSPSTSITMWSVSGDEKLSIFWLTQKITIIQRLKWRIVFDVNATTFYSGSNKAIFGIDDIIIDRSGACPPSDRCNFENGTCTWETVPVKQILIVNPTLKKQWVNSANPVTNYFLATDFQWTLHSPSLVDDPSLPSKDHTIGTNSGSYLLMRNSALRKEWDQATIMSHKIVIQPNQVQCLTFSYFITKSIATTKPIELLVVKSENFVKFYRVARYDISTQDWKTVSMNLKPENRTATGMYVFFFGTIGSPPGQGHIALDDISVRPGDCANNNNDKFQCNNGNSIDKSKVCDFYKDCPNGEDELNCGDCDFESGICGYTNKTLKDDQKPNMQMNELKWQRGGLTMNPKIGAKGNYYAIALRRSRTSNLDAKAKLYTSVLKLASEACSFEMYYYLNGTSSRLIVGIETNISSEVVVWDSNAYLNGRLFSWIGPINVRLERLRVPYRVVFTAYIPNADLKNFVAVDEIKFSTSCSLTFPQNPQNTCPPERNLMQCRNGNCVSNDVRCDFADQCGDNTDEENCNLYKSRCTFENTWCEWGTRTKIGWTRFGGTTDLKIRPTRDHTTGLSSGLFLLAKNQNQGTKTLTVNGPVFLANKKCQMRMFYNIEGNMKNNSYFTVAIQNTVTGVLSYTKTFQRSLNQFAFVREQIDFDDFTSNDYGPGQSFQVLLIAQLTADNVFNPYVAVDDISFSPNCDSPNVVPSTIPTVQPTPTSPPNTHTCKDTGGNTIILPQSRVCDFILDCADSSDEKNCGPCDFEEDLCGWKTRSGFVKWSRVAATKFTKQSYVNIPRKDGKNSSFGYFLIVDTSLNTNSRQPAVFVSPVIGKTSLNCKMSFKYHATSTSRGPPNLKVDLEIPAPNGQKQLKSHWQVSTVGSEWQNITFGIPNLTTGTQIVISADNFLVQSANRPYADVEIDEIKYINCGNTQPQPVNNNLTCAFEDNLCGWVDFDLPNQNDPLDWTITSPGQNPMPDPGFDHTSQIRPLPTKNGRFAYTKIIPNLFGNESATLMSINSLDPRKTKCLTFWYHLFGVDDAYLALKINTQQSTVGATTLWVKKTPQSNNWVKAQVTIGADQTFTSQYWVMFVAQLANNSRDTVGLDDIELTDGQCHSDATCDFELKQCSWKSLYNEWFFTNGRENSLKTPPVDHTTGTDLGGYGLVVVNPDMQGTATLQTKLTRSLMPMPNVATQVCLRFWIFLNSTSSNDQLIVKQIFRNATDQQLDNLQLSYFAKNQWLFRSVSVTGYLNEQLAIVASVNNIGSIVALDDVSVTPGQCEPMGQCSFESDFCGFYNAPQPSKRVLWLRTQGFRRSNRLTAPIYDHTTGGPLGWFLFVPLNQLTNGIAVLKSPTFRLMGPQNRFCISFYYHIMSSDTKYSPSLIVGYEVARQGGQSVAIATLNNTRNGAWIGYNYNFLASDAFRVVLSTVKQLQVRSDIAIDDVAIYRGYCLPNGPTTKAPPTTLRTTLRPIVRYDCDFDSRTCPWQNDGSWTVKSYTSKIQPTGPRRDHSSNSIRGKYLQFIPNSGNNGPYNYTSPVINEITQDDICFSFWYFAWLPSVNSWIDFSVNVVPNQNNQRSSFRLFKLPIEMIGLNQLLWKQISVQIPRNLLGVQIVLQVRRSNPSSQFLGNFALDDLLVKPGPCPQRNGVVCTFENGFCGFGISRIDNSTDDVYTAEQAKAANIPGPTFDHTTNTYLGKFYLFAHKQLDTKRKYLTKLIIPNLPPTDFRSSCLRFWYQNFAPNINNTGQLLSVFLTTESVTTPTAIWNTTFSVHTRWTPALVNIDINYKHTIIIQFDKQFSSTNIGSYIAVDDISILDYSCPNLASAVNCGFEYECYWSNELSGRLSQVPFRWTSFTLPPDNTTVWPGPYVDRTYRRDSRGSYIYLNTDSRYWFKGMNASIYSPPIRVTPGIDYCFAFYGAFLQGNYSNVTVEMVMNGRSFRGGNKTQILSVFKPNYNTFNFNKKSAYSWTMYQTNVLSISLRGAAEASFRIRGFLERPDSFIAVDEIQLSQEACYDSSINICGDGTILTVDKVCNFVPDCPGKTLDNSPDEMNCGQCDFEGDMCGWKSSTNPKWSLRNAAVGDKMTPKGPIVDSQNRRNGTYLIMEGTRTTRSSGSIQSNSRIFLIKQTSHGCQMTFDYFINSNHVPTSPREQPINLAVITDTNTRKAIVWRAVNSRGPFWNKATVHLDQWSSINLYITGYYPNNNSTLAIDNIKFVNCGPPKAKPIGYCKPEEIQCPDTKACRLQNTECDGVFDCSGNQNSSDELRCPYDFRSSWCDFERSSWNSTCNLIFPKPTKVMSQWKVVSSDTYVGRSYLKKTGPFNDHTFRRYSYGRFLVLSMASRTDAQKTINFTTVNYVAAPPSPGGNVTYCAIRFWYYMYGNSSQNGRLNLYAEFTRPGFPTTMWQLLSEPIRITNIQRWIRVVVPVKSQQPFKFVFEATIGDDNQTDIAIDDISYSNCQPYDKQLPTRIPTRPTRTRPTRPVPLEQKLDCTFNYDTCYWMQDTRKYWVVKKFNASARFPGPWVDHTTGAVNSTYLQIFPTKPLVLEPLVLWSPVIESSTSRSHCFTFWYNIFSFYQFNLTIQAKSDGDSQKIYNLMRVPSSRKGQWTMARIDVPQTRSKIRLFFTFTLLENMGSYFFDVAFDDFKLALGTCPPLPGIDCTFEEGFCPQYQIFERKSPNPSLQIGWVKNATTRGANPGPEKDHSLLTAYGNYFLFSNRPTDPTGYYSTSLLIQNVPYSTYYYSCFKFWYQSWSDSINSTQTLNVSTIISGVVSNKRLFEVPLYPNWTLAMIDLRPQTSSFNILMNFTKMQTVSEKGFIAIDDISLSSSPCVGSHLDCGFDTDLCGWTSTRGQVGQTSGTMWWNRFDRRQNLTKWPGPWYDRASWDLTGTYAYLYDPRTLVPVRGTLYSSPEIVTQTSCFSFYYVFIGPSLGSPATNSTIRIEAWLRDRRIPAASRTKVLATIMSGDISRVNRTDKQIWKPFYKTITTSDLLGAKEVVFAITGLVNNNKTILAIDDTSFYDRACPKNMEMFTCDDLLTQISASKVCNFIPDCPMLPGQVGPAADERDCGMSCGFNGGKCPWRSIGRGSWKTRTGQQIGAFPTGPTVDGSNSAQGSYLMVTPPRRGATNFITSFTSPDGIYLFKNTTYKCTMTFDYWIKNNDVTPPLDQLPMIQSRIWITVSNIDYSTNATVWRSTGPTLGAWSKANVNIPPTHPTQTSNTRFQVNINSLYTGIDTAIAIDNINFIDCGPPKSSMSCSAGQIQCPDTKVCINQFSTCDRINDCGYAPNSYYSWDESRTLCPSRSQIQTLCSFEYSLSRCVLAFANNTQVVKSKWLVVKSGAQRGSLVQLSRKTGPMIDNTYKDDTRGAYLTLFQGDARDAGKSLFFWSRSLVAKPNQQCAVRFFYFMFGNVNQPAQLNVYTQTSTMTQRVFSALTSNDQRWIRAIVPGPTGQQQFRFLFEGRISQGNQSDIAIDDISYSANCTINIDPLPTVLPTGLPTGFPTIPSTSLRSTLTSFFSTLTTKPSGSSTGSGRPSSGPTRPSGRPTKPSGRTRRTTMTTLFTDEITEMPPQTTMITTGRGVKAGTIIAAVLIPIVVLALAAIAGWWYVTKFRHRNEDDRVQLTVSDPAQTPRSLRGQKQQEEKYEDIELTDGRALRK